MKTKMRTRMAMKKLILHIFMVTSMTKRKMQVGYRNNNNTADRSSIKVVVVVSLFAYGK